MYRSLTVGMAVFAASIFTRTATAHAQLETIGRLAEVGNRIYQALSHDEMSIDEAVSQIIDEIAESRDAIINQMDNLAAIDARTCAKTTVGDFENLAAFGDNANIVARAMGDCVVLLHSTISAVQDLAVVDELGFALHAIAPLALVAYVFTGLSPDPVLAEVRDARRTLRSRLAPICNHSTSCEGNRHCECIWSCTAYNGDVGEDDRYCTVGDGDKNIAIEEALANTSVVRIAPP